MKKNLLTFLILIIAFAFIGCGSVNPGDEDSGEVDELTLALSTESLANYKMTLELKVQILEQTETLTSNLYVDNDTYYYTMETLGTSTYAYFFTHEGKKYFAIKTVIDQMSGNWVLNEIKSEEIEKDLKDTMGVLPEFSPNEFEKDEEGYYILKDESNHIDYITKFLEEIGVTKDDILEIYYKIKITNDKVESLKYVISLIVEGVSMTVEATGTFTDYGSTKVTVLDEVKELIN